MKSTSKQAKKKSLKPIQSTETSCNSVYSELPNFQTSETTGMAEPTVKVTKAIKLVLQDTNIIEDYIDEKNLLH